MLWLEDKLHFGGKLNFNHIRTIHIFVLSIPAAAVLWLYRNEDKKTDHKNAFEAQQQVLDSFKKDDLSRLIQIHLKDIEQVLNKEISEVIVKNCGDDEKKHVQIPLKKVLYKDPSLDNSFIALDSESLPIKDSMNYNHLMNLYRRLIGYIKNYKELVNNDHVAKHYADQIAVYVEGISDLPQVVHEYLCKYLDDYPNKQQ